MQHTVDVATWVFLLYQGKAFVSTTCKESYDDT